MTESNVQRPGVSTAEAPSESQGWNPHDVWLTRVWLARIKQSREIVTPPAEDGTSLAARLAFAFRL
jgi:hypothetical protein